MQSMARKGAKFAKEEGYYLLRIDKCKARKVRKGGTILDVEDRGGTA